MAFSPMDPCGVPPIVKRARPWLKAMHIGPPPGISDEECGTVESLYGDISGYSAYTDYWKPTPEQLEMLNKGGVIEFVQYTQQMVMHSVGVWLDEETSDVFL